ncbi:transcriptional regulator with XRE-family HTH domain [Variovorax boronicumulans]|uniref:helix-turn-helix domain-containing protein n=1 Tax=Variovorax boronicumulans TaxID=436515 RepID=UPI002474521A|nr:helix-turn-helix transcriptional regulator [Variovorax boronicumulans]MDH6164902.1 transcriptional regulator with XRE-family HTH domain [Variovorax boronicumulans]
MSGNFAERLKELTTDMNRGWQADLARRCGVTRSAITGWLSGQRSGIESTYLFITADYFGVNARWLATGVGPKWAEMPMYLTKKVHPNVGEVLAKFEEMSSRRTGINDAERIELYVWLVGERPSFPGTANMQTR